MCGGGGRTLVKTTKISMDLIKMKVKMILMKVLKERKTIKIDADYGDENNREKKL